jgi:hypothetical protein
MKLSLLLFIAILGLSSCQWGKAKRDPHDIFTDTLIYTYYGIHERAADCGSKPDSACTVVKVRYPVFVGEGALNDTIKSRLLNLIRVENKPDTSLDAYTRHFLKAYTDFKKDNPSSAMYYTLDSYVKVVNQDSALVAMECGFYTFQGGAHGASFTGFINWDAETNKTVSLKDIFKDGYKPQLTRIAEKIFRRNEKLKDTSSLARDYFFAENKFELNNNYSVTPLGLRFIYNQYEIKPYAAGQTELLIPYDQIKQLMRPKSVASQYLKNNAGI